MNPNCFVLLAKVEVLLPIAKAENVTCNSEIVRSYILKFFFDHMSSLITSFVFTRLQGDNDNNVGVKSMSR